MNRMTVFYDHIRNAALQEGLTIEEIATKLTSAGISGIEVDYRDIDGEEGFAFAKKMASLGLPVSSVYCTFNWNLGEEAVDYKHVLNNLEALGIKYLLAIPGFVKTTEEPAYPAPGEILPTHTAGMEFFLPYLTELCHEAKCHGIQVLMEDYDGVDAPFGTSAELRWYMERIPELMCAFDTGNFFFFGEDSYEALPGLIDRTVFVHCKDRSLTPLEGETPMASADGKNMYSSAVGSGIIKMTEIVNTLLEHGYTGTFAIEHFGSIKQLKDMLASAAYLKSLLGETVNMPKLYALSGKDEL